MGAVAISQNDEKMIGTLQKKLKLPSKSQVIHQALQTLQRVLAREQLAKEIRESVQRCNKADQKENRLLAGAAFHRLEEK